MTIDVKFEIEIEDESAESATDEQIKEWVEFYLGVRCSCTHSPMSHFDMRGNYVYSVDVYRDNINKKENE